MKYAIDKQFGLWRHMKQPVMGERFFRLAERIVKTEKYFHSHKNVNVDTITVQTPDNYPLKSYLITPNNLNSNAIILYLDNAEALGVSAEKIIVAGDSAGGNLALGVFYNAVNENITKPHALMLVYPVVDNLMQTESMKKFTDTPMWNAVLNEAMWKVYLPTDSAKDLFKRNHVEANLYTEFPSTYIESAEFDCLRDEALDLANKLQIAGINLTINETKGTMHGYDQVDCEISRENIKKRINWLSQTIR